MSTEVIRQSGYNKESFQEFLAGTLNQRPHLKANQKPWKPAEIAEMHREQASERIHKALRRTRRIKSA